MSNITNSGILLKRDEQIILEANAEVKSVSIYSEKEIREKTVGDGKLYLTNKRIFLVQHALVGKTERTVLVYYDYLSHIQRISPLDDKTLSIGFPGSNIDFHFKDKIANQWNEKILEVISE